MKRALKLNSAQKTEKDSENFNRKKYSTKFKMNIYCKIKMPLTHRLSLLYIILISGFKLGMAAPAENKKGEDVKKINDNFHRWN